MNIQEENKRHGMRANLEPSLGYALNLVRQVQGLPRELSIRKAQALEAASSVVHCLLIEEAALRDGVDPSTLPHDKHILTLITAAAARMGFVLRKPRKKIEIQLYSILVTRKNGVSFRKRFEVPSGVDPAAYVEALLMASEKDFSEISSIESVL